jgi:hypothetical protein
MASNKMVALVAVAILLFAGLPAIQEQRTAAVREAGDRTAVDGESVNISGDAGQIVNLAESNRSDVTYERIDSVDVRQNGTSFAPSGNFTWNVSNGYLVLDSNTNLNTSQNASNASVDYAYRTASAEQAAVTDVALIPFRLGEGILIAAGAGLTFAALVVVARRGGGR